MCVVHGGQTGADVEVLTDPFLFAKVAHGATEEFPIRACRVDDARDQLRDLVAKLAINLKAVFPAQPVVPYPRRVRTVRADSADR
jgi:hypothetical protein